MEQDRPFPSSRNAQNVMQELSQSLLSLQKPADAIITLIYCIPVLAPIRMCIETDVFAQLSASQRPMTALELAERLPRQHTTKGQSEQGLSRRRDFLVRMLRAICAVRLVDEVGPFTYCANDLTKVLADPSMAAGFKLVYDNSMGPSSTMSEMLSYAQLNSYEAPISAEEGPFQQARGVKGKSTFDHWIDKDPEQLSRLNTFMQRVQKDRPHWTEWFPAEALFTDPPVSKSDKVFFVDVGGGLGHDISALAMKYHDRKIRLVLQDLPSVIEEGKQKAHHKLDDRIELVEHDFFRPQPVQSSIYYMHKIMHDWPDSDCVKILAHLRDAMLPESRILINDVIIPSVKCPLLPAAFDITMLALHSGQERDEEMWKRLIDQVDGLSIRKFWYPPSGDGEGIVEVIRHADEAWSK